MVRAHIVAVAGIGIGLAGTVFALADPYGFRPLPYADPDRLVRIEIGTADLLPSSPVPAVRDWQARRDIFVDLAAYEVVGSRQVRTTAGLIPVEISRASANFFSTLGIGGVGASWQPASATTAIPIVIAGRLWPDRAAPNSSTLETDAGDSYIVAGRLPEHFVLPEKPRARGAYGFVAYEPGPVVRLNWSANGSQGSPDPVGLVARLRPGVTPDAVAGALGTTADGRRLELRVVPLTEVVTGHVRATARAAVALAAFLVLLCTANVANLWTARFAYRLRELETRRMLGASAQHLVRLLASEYVLVAGATCLLSLGVCGFALSLASGVVPPEYAVLGEPSLSLRAAAAICLTVVVVAALGIAPASVLAVRKLTRDKFDSARAFAAAARARQCAFVAVQASLAMMLVVGSSALIRSTANLFRQATGYDDNVLFTSVVHGVVTDGRAEIDAVLARLRRVPGVRAVAAMTGVVAATDSMAITYVSVDGVEVRVDSARVTEGYFDVVGLRLVEGRLLGPRDVGQTAVIIDKAFADAHWPGQPAIGRVIFHGSRGMQVVGVVDNVLRRGLATPAHPTVYELLGEHRSPFLMASYVARTTGDPSGRAGEIRQAIIEAAPGARVDTVGTIGGELAESVREETFATLVLGLFAVTGTIVCLGGTASVVAVGVVRRRKEMAVRLALGSSPGAAMTLVLRDAAMAAAGGATAGVLAGRWLVGGLDALIHGVEASAWSTTLLAASLLLATTAAAAIVPALRVRDVRPAELLQAE